MSPDDSGNTARLIAPIALAVCAIAFFAVVLASGSGDGGDDRAARTAERTTTRERTRRRTRPAPAGATYTVKAGDTLGGIAEETGVPVERLQELNPDMDPQALVSGQKLKLR